MGHSLYVMQVAVIHSTPTNPAPSHSPQVFEGHSHYVMQVVFNPKDPNTFATASLDCTVKIWSLGSPIPNFTLEGHAKGVNCIDYYPGGDRPYLISGADDATVRVWDYQAREMGRSGVGGCGRWELMCVKQDSV